MTLEPFDPNLNDERVRILIIDDEPDVTLTLRTALEQNGFRTDSCDDSTLEYKNFRDGKYNLVLLDIKMPNVGKHEEIRKEEGFDGFNNELFLRKPIEIANLVDAIKTLLNSN